MPKPYTFKINARIAALALLLGSTGWAQNSALQAQQSSGGPITVSSVSSRPTGNGTQVSIAADGALSRAQTWQDREGYHVVVPSAGAQNAIKAGKGIKVRQLDRTLEIVIQTKPGANVTVQPLGNHLNLNIEGKLDPRSSDAETADSSAKSSSAETDHSGSSSADAKAAKATKAAAATQEMPAATSLADSAVRFAVIPDPSPVRAPREPAQGATQEAESASGEFSVISGTTVLVVLALGGMGLLVLRRHRSTGPTVALVDEDGFSAFDAVDFSDDLNGAANKPAKRTKSSSGSNYSSSTIGSISREELSSALSGESRQRKSPQRTTLAIPASLYGAYQVDKEIGKLVQGQPHKMDVVGSRAADDRRAIEASLLKTLVAAGASEESRRRARTALEEYGFVARQSAALLLAADPYERTSAARMLGDVKSPAALPFLLEALYDHESLVRNQAVLSIGELRIPSAIGALLDIARKHPDVPGALLSRALTACSLDGLDFFDSPVPEPRQLSGVNARVLAMEITKLEPASVVQELSETSADEKFAVALTKIESEDVDERSEAVKVLGQFSTRDSVAALARVAQLDEISSVRAVAISSLAFINHESVFPAILIAMADESRGVRAAAARSLSRLSFDRADAYIRVTETDDLETLQNVAQACVKAGIAGQGIDRLASGDHQAYEALSVVSLLLKANVVEPLFDAIANHPNLDVRLTTAYILGLVGRPEMLAELRQLAADCTAAEVKSALLETIAKLEAPQQVEYDAGGTGFAFVEQPKEESPAQLDEVAAHFETGFATPLDFEFETSWEGESEDLLESSLEPSDRESDGRPARTIA